MGLFRIILLVYLFLVTESVAPVKKTTDKVSPVQDHEVKNATASPAPPIPAPTPVVPPPIQKVKSAPVTDPAAAPILATMVAGQSPATTEQAPPITSKSKKQPKQAMKDVSQTPVESMQTEIAAAHVVDAKEKAEPMIVDIPEQSKPSFQETGLAVLTGDAPKELNQPEPMEVALPQPSEAPRKGAPKVTPKPAKGKKGAVISQSDEVSMPEHVEEIKSVTVATTAEAVSTPTPVAAATPPSGDSAGVAVTTVAVPDAQPTAPEQSSEATVAGSASPTPTGPVEASEKSGGKSKKNKGKSKK